VSDGVQSTSLPVTVNPTPTPTPMPTNGPIVGVPASILFAGPTSTPTSVALSEANYSGSFFVTPNPIASVSISGGTMIVTPETPGSTTITVTNSSTQTLGIPVVVNPLVPPGPPITGEQFSGPFDLTGTTSSAGASWLTVGYGSGQYTNTAIERKAGASPLPTPTAIGTAGINPGNTVPFYAGANDFNGILTWNGTDGSPDGSNHTVASHIATGGLGNGFALPALPGTATSASTNTVIAHVSYYCAQGNLTVSTSGSTWTPKTDTLNFSDANNTTWTGTDYLYYVPYQTNTSAEKVTLSFLPTAAECAGQTPQIALRGYELIPNSIVQIGNSSSTFGASGTNPTFSGLPARTGDVQVIIVTSGAAAIESHQFSAIPTGCTRIDETQDVGNGGWVGSYVCVSSLSAGPIFTLTNPHSWAGTAIEYSGASGTIDVHSIAGTASPGSASDASTAITPTLANDLLVASYSLKSAIQGVTTPPAGFSEIVPIGGANGSTFAQRTYALFSPALTAQQPALTWTATAPSDTFAAYIALAPVSTSTVAPTATPLAYAYEQQAPAFAINTAGATSAPITATLATTPPQNSMLIFSAMGGLATGNNPGGGITGWTTVYAPSGGIHTYGVWAKCAAASEGKATTITLNNRTDGPAEGMLVSLSNTGACPGSVTATVPNPLPSVSATQQPWDAVNKVLAAPTITSAQTGTYVMTAYDWDGLNGSYYPAAASIVPPMSIVTGGPVYGESTTTLTASNVSSDFAWTHGIVGNPTTFTPTMLASEMSYNTYVSTKTPYVLEVRVPPSATVTAAPPLPSPTAVTAFASNSLLQKMGVNSHLSYQDTGGGAYYYFAQSPAPNGNALVQGATGTGRNIFADMTFRHIRDGYNSNGGTLMCGWYHNTLGPLGYDFDFGTHTFDTAASWTTDYNCVTNNGAHPTWMLALEGLNEYNTPGNGNYQLGGNTGSTTSPHPSVTIGPLPSAMPLASPSPSTATCNGTNWCTTSNWPAYVFAEQLALFNARSASASATASPFPSTVKLLSAPLIFAAQNTTDFTAAGAYMTSQGYAPGSLTDGGNIHGYSFVGLGNPDVPGAGGHSALYDTLVQTQITNGTSPVQPVTVTETGTYSLPTANGGSQPAYIDFPTQSKYLLRTFLQGFVDGASNIYIYDLTAENQPDGYALLDGWLNPTPAYTSLRNFVQILTDTGDTFPPTAALPSASLSYTLNDVGLEDVRTLLLEKADGSFWLILWRDDAGFENSNSPTPAPIAIPTVSVNLLFAAPNTSYKTWAIDPLSGIVTATTLTAYANTAAVTVPVNDMPIILQIGGTASVPVPATPQPVACPAGYSPVSNPTAAPLCGGNPFPTPTP
jgi:hypothetical protein